jgi:phenylalanyl-tRNA synthetase beta chain
MIQCNGRSVALAGVMGGFDTEVTPTTRSLLLESANFDGATIRRTATRLGLRSDASARFEKSLDPANTVLAIQRFIQLARPMYPKLRLASRLADAYPRPAPPLAVRVNPRHVARTLGREVPSLEATAVLAPLDLGVTDHGAHWTVSVPSFRATGDVSIEADVIEELARRIGYDTVQPAMPLVSARQFAIHALHELEQRTLEYFTDVHAFNEIHGYLWYDSAWLAQLGIDPGPCIELANPAAEGLHRLRRTLLPGLLAAVTTNRFHFPSLSLLELGSVFEKSTSADGADGEFRHVGFVLGQRGRGVEDELLSRLKGAITGWAWRRFGQAVSFREAAPLADRAWEHPVRTLEVMIDGTLAGRASAVDAPLRRRADEHLAAWGIAWAELRLSRLETLPRVTEKLGAIPPFPQVEMDFSILVPKHARYAEVVQRLRRFEHGLLKWIRFVTSYEGTSIPQDRRSLTFRTILGDDARTLTDADATTFREAFERYLGDCGYDLRTG